MAAFHYFAWVELVSPQDMLWCDEQPISDNVKTLKGHGGMLGKSHCCQLAGASFAKFFSQVTN